MRRTRLLWQLSFSFVLVAVLSLLVFTLYMRKAVRDFYLESTAVRLQTEAEILAVQLPHAIDATRTVEVDRLCKQMGSLTNARVTVILPGGEVLGDSHRDPKQMENHRERPEVQEALHGRIGRSLRFSTTVGEEEMYVATPVGPPNAPRAIVRSAMSIEALNASLGSITFRIALGGAVIVVLAASLGVLLSRRLSHPIEEMKAGAERFARGELDSRLAIPSSAELGRLAETLNEMAAQLDDRIRTILAQRNEMEAVLASMVEGVLAIDSGEKLISLNQAAARLFGLDSEKAVGRTIHEAVRNAELQRFVTRTLASTTPVEDEIVVHDKTDRYLQAHGTALRDAKGHGIGALVVLNDVTPLRRTEIIRRDFVANVSHELKTPITSIKGFVETLLDGSAKDPEQVRHFLGIVGRQADRLNAILDDLLTLSQIEAEAQQEQITLETARLHPILFEAVRICEVKAKARAIRIELACPEDLSGRINPPLLEQAIVNLVDNAVKYSEDGKAVGIEAQRGEGGIVISVRDSGCGIEKEHQSRIFERFYRVDKARSRKLGGTGLGLAIVKHIMQAHHGHVDVESTPGQGSVFNLRFPSNGG